MAIDGTYRAYAVTPTSDTTDASQEAAVTAASCGVLKGLFPNRSALYQPAYDAYIANTPASDAKIKGLAVGDEVAKTGTVSSIRTDAQLEIARFHTEPPRRFWPRNLSNFAMTNQLQIRQHDY